MLSAAEAGCGWVSFERRLSDQEYAARSEIRVYYEQVQTVYAAGNAQALAGLYDPGITQPMTRAQILAWGEKFFGENTAVRFKVLRLEFDVVGAGRAVVTLTYRVITEGGRGDFSGTETDILEKHGGRWKMMSWEKR